MSDEILEAMIDHDEDDASLMFWREYNKEVLGFKVVRFLASDINNAVGSGRDTLKYYIY